MFFETPTQVKFWDVDGGHYTAGIAYKNEIICGCCGGIFEIEEIIEELDVIYVTRLQRERFPDPAKFFDVSSSYRITPSLLSDVKEHLAILHPLPRVDEIDPAVDCLPYARYFEQARNGVPVRMAMLTEVMS